MRSEFRDREGRLIGWTQQNGTRIDARDAQGRLLGWYQPDRDETRDPSGRLVGRGNTLSRFF